MSTQELSQYQKAHPPSETRTVKARFYPFEVGDPPGFVVIDGVAYRREDDQEGINRQLAINDIDAELVSILDEKTWHLVFELSNLHEEEIWHELRLAEARLIELLPNHEPAIKRGFHPDEYDLDSQEYVRHHFCTLAEAMPPEE